MDHSFEPELPRPHVTEWRSEWDGRKGELRCTFLADAALAARVVVSDDEIAAVLTAHGSGDMEIMDITPRDDDAFRSIYEAQRAVAVAANVLSIR